MIKPEKKIMAARKALLDMKENLLAEGRRKSPPDNLDVSLDIGDEGDTDRTHEISVLLSLRDKEKLLAIDEALEKLREGTYGICEECGDEIGSERLKAMPLARLCVPCQSRLEKETAHQKFAEGRFERSLISEGEVEEANCPLRAGLAFPLFRGRCTHSSQDKSFFICSNSSFLISPRAYRFFKMSRGVSVSRPEGYRSHGGR